MTKHVKALDGVRGLAILLVLIFHFAEFRPNGAFERVVSAGIEFGWCGVDLFFCLSGFLITGILLRTAEHADYFRLFYARRIVRIFPAYYLYIAVTVLAVVAGHRFGYRRQVSTHNQIWAWLYLSNWHGSGLPYTSHTWSLAVEEQFYLIWPSAILAFRRRPLPFCLWVAALSIIARVVGVYLFGLGGETIYRLTPFRLDGLALGGAAACIASSPEPLSKLKGFVPWIFGGCLAIAVATAVAAGSSAFTSQMNTIGYAAMAISFSALVLHCATTTGAITKVFLFPPLRDLGKYSYGIYIFHYVWLRPNIYRSLNGAILWMIVASVGTYTLARVSWRFVEQPFLRLKKNFEYEAAPATS